MDLMDESLSDVLFTTRDRFEDAAVTAEQLDVIVSRIDGFGTVTDHQVAAFLLQFDGGAKVAVVGFQGEADDPLIVAFALAQDGDDIRGLDEFQLQRLARFGELSIGHLERLVVAGCRGADGSVTPGEHIASDTEHLLGGDDVDDVCAIGIVERDGTGHNHDVMTIPQRRGGKSSAHPSARRVGQVSHRIEVLSRGTGCDQDFGAGWGGIAHAGSSLDPRGPCPLTTDVIISSSRWPTIFMRAAASAKSRFSDSAKCPSAAIIEIKSASKASREA